MSDGSNIEWTDATWTLPDRLTDPLRWRKPRKVFVNSMSDLFHKDVPFEFIDKVFAVMALCPQHTFRVLTKRPERMAEYLALREPEAGYALPRKVLFEMNDWREDACGNWTTLSHRTRGDIIPRHRWPLPNVWLGTSVEDQPTGSGARFADRKGADPSEWPEDLRMREFPRGKEVPNG